MLFEREAVEYKPIKIVLETQEDFDAFKELVDAVNADHDFKKTLSVVGEEIAIELINNLGTL